MTVDAFITTLLPFAKAAETKFKVPALVALAQSALESAWGSKAPGNMFFGIKAGTSWTGKKQLLATTEYHNNPNVKYPVVISITKLADKNGKPLYEYKIKDYFRAYDSPAGSFEDYAKFLTYNARYKKAFGFIDPISFAREIAKAGYATDPNYFNTLQTLINQLKKKAWSLGLVV